MTKKIFVGRLPFDFTNEQLEKLFAPAGSVLSAIMVPDAKNGRSRGFGFVTMKNDAETAAAIQTLNGKRVGEKEIWVTEAKEKTSKPAKPAAFRKPESGERKPFGRGPSEGFGSPRPPRPGFFQRDRKPFGRSEPGESARGRFPSKPGTFPERRPNRFGPRPEKFTGRPASGFSAPRSNRFGPKGRPSRPGSDRPRGSGPR